MDVLSAFSDGITSTRTLNYLAPVRIAAEKSAAEDFCTAFDVVARKLSA
jgi:hypothetical protein